MLRIFLYFTCLAFWLPGILNAQRVIYSQTFNGRSSLRFHIIGKSGNFYWVAKLQKQKSYNRHSIGEIPDILSFAMYDAKLNWQEELSSVVLQGTIKQWLVAGNKGLDQVTLSVAENKTRIICTRFPTDVNADPQMRLIDSLPFTIKASAFILVRSADQSKILLVAFENTGLEFTRLHTLLFDEDWNVIYHKSISKDLFSQPCIQDDETGFPSESFDNLPIKLANNGEWLMAYPSRISKNFSLFHACANGTDYYFREIPVSPYYKMEDISMSIDNEKGEMGLGLLSAYSKTTFKNVQIINYSMIRGSIDFDTSFRFNTQALDIRNKNLSHESFISVPGKGFLFLKEYGTPYEFSKPPIPTLNEFETAYLLANNGEMKTGKEQIQQGYSFNPGLSPIPIVHNRGDLNLFYFPAISKDSAWTGVLEMEQHSESNNPSLSYLLIPSAENLYIIYNATEGSSDVLATTTTLNMHGQTTSDALIFWKMNRLMNFQLSRRFLSNEIAVPFLNNQQRGFAIIRL